MVRRILILVSLLSLGCESIDDSRARWLENRMFEEHQDILLRNPEGTKEKFRKMALTPYNFFRGTASLFYFDMTDATQPRPAGSVERVVLIGDPHPENIGTFFGPNNQIVIDFNDYDASQWGPSTLDLWRLALGFEVAERQATSFECDGAAASVFEGYNDYVGAESRVLDSGGVIAADLTRRAIRDGELREELLDYTELREGARVMRLGVLEAPSNGVKADEMHELSLPLSGMVNELVRDYTSRFEGESSELVLKDVAERFGAGVSSYPLFRFYALFEGPSKAVDDDVLLEFRETLPGPVVRGMPIFPNETYGSNAERIVKAQQRLQGQPLDPWLGWAGATSSRMSFKVTHRTKYKKGFGVDRLEEKFQEGDWSCADLDEFARFSGQLLAHAHLSQAPVLQTSDETEFVRAYADQLLEDFQWLREFLQRESWLLP